MSNPAAATAGKPAEAAMKTPRYAWPCLIVSLLCAVSIVFAWQWLPGVTFPVFQGWEAANNPTFNPAMMSNVMGLVPIGALIMALPTSYLVRKWGPKFATSAGMIIAIIGHAMCSAFAASDFTLFLAGRFILGLGLSTTIVAGPTCVSIWFPHGTRGRAMAIWSCWAPIGIFTINAISSGLVGIVGGDISVFLWIWVVVMVVILIAFIVVFREPRAEEASEVSAERKSFKDVLPFFKSRQLWCLILMFAIFNYMNYSFSQYLKTWLQLSTNAGGMGWDAGMAGILGGLICACGALAPLGGFILDKTPKHLKYLCVVAGITGLTICCALSFQNSVPMFAAFVLFFCIGNMFLNGCCRPMVPTYVFKGGATAVAFGLSFLTLGQYLGQIPTSYVLHGFVDSMAFGKVDPSLAFWALVPVGVIGIIFSLLMHPSKPKAGAEAPQGAPKAAPAGDEAPKQA